MIANVGVRANPPNIQNQVGEPENRVDLIRESIGSEARVNKGLGST